MNKYSHSKIYVSIPAINEMELIPLCVECLKKQTFKNFEVYICVNQPDEWWDDSLKKEICLNNINTIEFLKKVGGIPIKIIDKTGIVKQ